MIVLKYISSNLILDDVILSDNCITSLHYFTALVPHTFLLKPSSKIRHTFRCIKNILCTENYVLLG